MDKYNILEGQVTLDKQTVGEFLTSKIGEVGSDLISGLVTAAFGFGMVIFLIVGITLMIKMGQESNVQKKQNKKKRAINAFLSAIGLAIATTVSASVFLAIPIEFGDLIENTVLTSTLSDYTSFSSYVHLPLIIS